LRNLGQKAKSRSRKPGIGHDQILHVVRVGIHDVMTHVNFGANWLRGFGVARGRIFAVSTDLRHRHYAAVGLSCMRDNFDMWRRCNELYFGWTDKSDGSGESALPAGHRYTLLPRRIAACLQVRPCCPHFIAPQASCRLRRIGVHPRRSPIPHPQPYSLTQPYLPF